MTIEIPRALRTRPRDPRGYPVPYVVLVDDRGRAHFTVNDIRKLGKAIRSKLCAMCGRRMERSGGYWFIGGAGSALLPMGRFIDGPSHEDCARYAMRVCPYLAAPRYAKRIDDRTIDPAALPGTLIAFDPSMDARRPPVFVLAATDEYETEWGDGQMPYFNPRRPWVRLEYWRCGQRIEEAEGNELARGAIERLLREGRTVPA